MKNYEEVYEMLEMNKSDGEKAILKCWLENYEKYMNSRVKLADVKRSFEHFQKNHISYNEYFIKRQEVEVGYYRRALELFEEQNEIFNQKKV
jgi:hypothetical protein